MKDKLYIIGTGGFAKEVAEICRRMNLDFSFASRDRMDSFYGEEVVLDSEIPTGSRFILGVGAPRLRKYLGEKMESLGMIPYTLIDSTALVSETDSVQIGAGSIICGRAIITADVVIGKYCIINLSATIGHGCRLGDYVGIAPGTHLNGDVIIGELASVGSNVTTVPGAIIEREVVVGAGAVVRGRLLEGRTYVGVPAKELKK